MATKTAEGLEPNPVLLSLDILRRIECAEPGSVVSGEWATIWHALHEIKVAAGPKWNADLFPILCGDKPPPKWLAAIPSWTVLNDTLNLIYGRVHP